MINNPFQSPESRRKRVLTIYEFKRKTLTRAELKRASKRRKLMRACSITSAVALCFTALWFANRASGNSIEVAVAARAVSNLEITVIRQASTAMVAQVRWTRPVMTNVFCELVSVRLLSSTI